MQDNVFGQQMEAARKRWETLFEQVNALPTKAPLVAECLEKLSISTQELELGVQEKVHDWEISFSPREGPPFYGALTVSTVRDAKGRLVGLRWLIQDITRRCRAEEALRGSEERFRVFMQNLPGIAFMKD